MSTVEDRRRHEPVIDRLERLMRRGQEAGDFDDQLPTTWLVASTIALGHAAGAEIGAGRMTLEDARQTLRESALRLVRRAHNR